MAHCLVQWSHHGHSRIPGEHCKLGSCQGRQHLRCPCHLLGQGACKVCKSRCWGGILGVRGRV